MSNWWDSKNEQAKPDVSSEELKQRKERAKAIRETQKKQSAERWNKAFVPPPKEPSQIKAKIDKWRAGFREFRNQQARFAQWGRLNESLPAVVFRKDDKPICYELKHYQPLDVPSGENLSTFDKLWRKYDEEGCGFLGYRKFKDLLSDVGFGFGFGPGCAELDPMQSGKISFDLAAKWWFKGQSPSLRPRVNRKKRAIVDAVQCLEESLKEKKDSKFKLFSKQQARRAKKNGQTKANGKRAAFRKFRKQNKGKLQKRFKIEVSSKDFKQVYDLTNFSPADYSANETEIRGLNTLWKKFDKNMLGFAKPEDVGKLLEEVTGIEGLSKTENGFPEDFAKGGDVSFDDFASWWFEAKFERPQKKQKEEEKENEQKDFKKKFEGERKSFREFRKKNANKESKWNLNFFIGKDQKFESNVEFYAPVFAPKGSETQLKMLDKIWKKVDKDGFGQMDGEKFTSFLKKQGIQIAEGTLESLKSKDKVTFEKFATWWFTGPSKGVSNVSVKASPEKVQKVNAIRAQTNTINRKFVSKFDLDDDKTTAAKRLSARAKYNAERQKFSEFRSKTASDSPVKKDNYDFEYVISFKDSNGLTVIGKQAVVIG